MSEAAYRCNDDRARGAARRGLSRKRGRGIGLRLGVRTTGCSGMAYKLEYADVAQPSAVRKPWCENLRRPKSLAYIDGTELDFAREGLNEGFKFNNPRKKPLRLRRILQHLKSERAIGAFRRMFLSGSLSTFRFAAALRARHSRAG